MNRLELISTWKNAIMKEVEAKPDLQEEQRTHDEEMDQIQGGISEEYDMFTPPGQDTSPEAKARSPSTAMRTSIKKRQAPGDNGDDSLLRPHVARTIACEDFEPSVCADVGDTAGPMRAGDGIDMEDTSNIPWLYPSGAHSSGHTDEGNNMAAHLAMVATKVLINAVDVTEVYRQPRVVPVAKAMGLSGGSSMDITTVDETGRPLEFNCVNMGNKVVRRVHEEATCVGCQRDVHTL